MLISCSTGSKKGAYSSLSDSSSTKSSSRKTSQSSGGEVKGVKKPSDDGSHSIFNGGKFDEYGIYSNFMNYKHGLKYF
jgi:hypothetical protein